MRGQDVFEMVGVIQPREEVTIGEAQEAGPERNPLSMRWAPEADLDGPSIMRIHWVEDINAPNRK